MIPAGSNLTRECGEEKAERDASRSGRRKAFLRQSGLPGRHEPEGLETLQKYFTSRSDGSAAILSKGNPSCLFDVQH